MFDYTLTIFNKEYKVSALTYWTAVAVSVVAMVVSIVMAVEGLCKISAWLPLAWILLSGYLAFETNKGLHEFCIIKSKFWRNVVDCAFLGAGLVLYFIY